MKSLDQVRSRRTVTPERREAIDLEREVLAAEVALHALREARGVSQATLADRLDVSRPRVSTIERAGEDLRISTARRYVEALGGRMRVVATFDGEDTEVLV